ncbi:dihydrolipoamide acetyltransferase component of pyruvate dehydrogenase complex [Acrocarpospora corrugata]|uniref:Dihydrolipoamide acetyltransferase component of pyruvate dehydrogenase complex n=1 Tax=Acrocarpospora corrugata TaxID=35763 RepID=A0A5M3W245_9ACTN|nr:dihydrolipoamide acetyltransferase family protein [Acrocarpospora corrugata]GES02102.1 dihydrolipoamide acetyltransferase component of pyruvate dehydrogenase complex [Acrocarpospora corrugata]
MRREFKLPDVGEGLTEAEIVRWHVSAGEPVRVNQIIVEIETAKAVVELPSPFEGTVAGLLVNEGDTVDVGSPIIAVDTVPDEENPPPAQSPALTEDMVPRVPDPETASAREERQPVLVGYGVKLGATKRRPRKNSKAPASVPTIPNGPNVPAGATSTTSPISGTSGPTGMAGATSTAGSASSATGANGTNGTALRSAGVLAKPPVRKLAKDLGVDLASIAGTGPQGSITREDVQAARSESGQALPASIAPPTVGAAPSASAPPMGAPATAFAPSMGVSPTVGALAREERIPVRGVRKATAAAMVASAFTAPHVTEFLQVDVTETMDAVRRLRLLPDFDGVKVSPLLLVAKALLTAVRRHPMANATWTDDAIVVKRYVNLGIAAATERGLIVPNVKDADAMSLPELARALGELTERARAGRCGPAELTGGTITITNVGVFGVDAGTPILNPGEAAILAFGQIRDMPWVVDGQLAVRKVTTLALSFDHRVIDGEIGSYVLRDVGAMLTDPLRMLAWS